MQIGKNSASCNFFFLSNSFVFQFPSSRKVLLTAQVNEKWLQAFVSNLEINDVS